MATTRGGQRLFGGGKQHTMCKEEEIEKITTEQEQSGLAGPWVKTKLLGQWMH